MTRLDADTLRLVQACLGRRVVALEVGQDADAQDWIVFLLEDRVVVRIALADLGELAPIECADPLHTSAIH
jgi:hypothetical protein